MKRSAIAVAIVLVLAVVGVAWAQQAQQAPDMTVQTARNALDVLVVYAHEPLPAAAQQRLQAMANVVNAHNVLNVFINQHAVALDELGEWRAAADESIALGLLDNIPRAPVIVEGEDEAETTEEATE